MEVKMKIDYDKNFIDEMKTIFSDEIHKIIDEHPEVFTDETKKKFRLFAFSDVFLYSIDLFDQPSKTKYGVNQIKSSVFKYMNRWSDVTCKSTMMYYTDDGTIDISKLIVFLNIDSLAKDIIMNMFRLDSFVEALKIDARHEIGHIMDYISCQGMSVEKYDEMAINDQKAYDDHFKWREALLNDKTLCDKSLVSRSKIMRQLTANYYKLPAEWRADTLAGIDRRAYLDMWYNDTINYEVDVPYKYTVGSENNAE